MSEFEVIRRFFTHRALSAVLGVGDDAAIVRPSPGKELVISTDMLVSGRHFEAHADPRLVGHKALAVNLSDIAAMGGTPRWVTLSLALPRVEVEWVKAFAAGFMALARKFDVDLIGGDTTRGPLAVCVQIIGEAPRGKALRRDGARVGDDVWVSGRVGDAGLALAARAGRLRIDRAARVRLERKLDAPTPRVALGQALVGVARSAIDVSDGLVADLGHICERSRVCAEIEWMRVPKAAAARGDGRGATAEAVLAGGDDYELCFTAAPARRRAIEAAGRAARVPVTRIGRVVTGRPSRVLVMDGAGKPLALRRAGYDHFRG